jgi:glycerol-3-phosphate dehydrogenase
MAVIGGGIIGAGIARDASLRGFSVCLFEKDDYASGTTSGSTRLIHGGLRYLEMFDFGLVRMDLRERETLLRIAPHLVKPLEFLIPFYSRTLFDRWKLHAGMLLYDALSYDKSLPGYRALDVEEVLDAEPALRREGLQGGVAYFDAQVESPERLTVENIVDARAHGAITFNYAEVTGAVRAGDGIRGVRVRDVLGGDEVEVRARVVVNASGPWFDRVSGRITPDSPRRIRTTKGIHIACPPVTRRAVVLFSNVDERLFFVIPLLGFAWIGTTDTDYTDDPSDVQATREDIEYLVHSAAEYVPAIEQAPIYWANAGVRALVMQEGRESDVSRSHRIESSPGLVSVLGGKITGYRYIAEEAVDAASEQLGSTAQSTTGQVPLPGARRSGIEGLKERVHTAVAEEQCFRLKDFMLRRSTLGLAADQGEPYVAEVAGLMAEELGWSVEEAEQEIRSYESATRRTREFIRDEASSNP